LCSYLFQFFGEDDLARTLLRLHFQVSAEGIMAADVDLHNRAVSSDPYVTVEVCVGCHVRRVWHVQVCVFFYSLVHQRRGDSFIISLFFTVPRNPLPFQLVDYATGRAVNTGWFHKTPTKKKTLEPIWNVRNVVKWSDVHLPFEMLGVRIR
jgi:hypothetical protein